MGDTFWLSPDSYKCMGIKLFKYENEIKLLESLIFLIKIYFGNSNSHTTRIKQLLWKQCAFCKWSSFSV